MGKQIRVGIIGIQGFGSTYFKTLESIQNVTVTALCDIDVKAARSMAANYGVVFVCSNYKDLLAYDGVDAVFIATPHYLHHSMTMDALRAGKHVFCEKPLAITSQHAWEMAKTSRELGLVLSCHYNRRQTAPVKMLRDIIAQGILGEIYVFNVKWMARWTGFLFDNTTSWRVSKEKAGGGILIGRGSHMIDAALYILDYPKISSIYSHISTKLTGFEVDDYAFLSMRLANGGLINMECSYENNIPNYQEKIEYEVFGTKAGAFCSMVDGLQTIKVGHCEYPQNKWVDLSDGLNLSSYENAEPKTIIGDFIIAIQTERDPIVTAEQGAFITQILEAAYRSSDAGREILF
jgi:predicted dehydrogenase